MADDAMLRMNNFWTNRNTISAGITTIDVNTMTWAGT
jgi:hypothetical protein